MSEEQEKIDIKQQMDMSYAVALYLKSAKRFDEAESDINKRCEELEEKLKPGDRFVVKVEWTYYLVQLDRCGSVDISEIQVF